MKDHDPRWKLRSARNLALCLLLPCLAYVASAVVVFDLRAPAPSGDEEDFEGKPVAFGPHPRWPFTYGGNLDFPAGWDFSGNEPVFRILRPICDAWRYFNGYEAPSEWRRQPDSATPVPWISGVTAPERRGGWLDRRLCGPARHRR